MAGLSKISSIGAFAVVLLLFAQPGKVPGQSSASAADSNGTIVAVWAIQVGAFADSANAARLCARLRSKGLDPVVYDNLIDGTHLLHLVWVGRFDTPQQAIPEIARIEELTGIRGVLREQMVWRKKK